MSKSDGRTLYPGFQCSSHHENRRQSWQSEKPLCTRRRNLDRETMTVKLLDFYADWCGPCKTQDPILDDLQEDWGDVEFEKVDVDEHQDVANEYQVRSIPTIVIEDDEGVVERFVGVTQRDDLERVLEEAGA
ncbi:thioredoxin family protein [Haladaptatus cibarius]|nr:thioredoxin family protein [Haladaptatus cibarius]